MKVKYDNINNDVEDMLMKIWLGGGRVSDRLLQVVNLILGPAYTENVTDAHTLDKLANQLGLRCMIALVNALTERMSADTEDIYDISDVLHWGLTHSKWGNIAHRDYFEKLQEHFLRMNIYYDIQHTVAGMLDSQRTDKDWEFIISMDTTVKVKLSLLTMPHGFSQEASREKVSALKDNIKVHYIPDEINKDFPDTHKLSVYVKILEYCDEYLRSDELS